MIANAMFSFLVYGNVSSCTLRSNLHAVYLQTTGANKSYVNPLVLAPTSNRLWHENLHFLL